MQCSLCEDKAIYEVRYSGASLCEYHFTEFFEKRVKREIKSQMRLGNSPKTIAVALSGGKDSSVLLHLVHKFLSKRKNTRIIAVTVDEGIQGYRNLELESARKLCNRLGVEQKILSFADEYGLTIDEIVQKDPATIPCAHCGPMRRQVMNTLAMGVDADYILLGINLDDYAQSAFMNVIRGDLSRMKRMAPHTGMRGVLVPRVIPLKQIPEKEVMIYAVLNGIKQNHVWCPYYGKAQRNEARDMINLLEDKHPGTTHSIASFADEIKGTFNAVGDMDLHECSRCGKPTYGVLCSVCQNLEKMIKS